MILLPYIGIGLVLLFIVFLARTSYPRYEKVMRHVGEFAIILLADWIIVSFIISHFGRGVWSGQ
jgi:hypothetical protein